MLTPEQYLGAVAERIQRSGGQLNTVQIGPAVCPVGLFAESVLMSTMNYCVIAAAVPEVTAAALYDFTGRATQHARANLVGTMGWTASSVVIAGLVGQRVYPDAAQAASAKSGNQVGGETRMVAVDLTAGQTYAFTGGKMWGAAMHGAIRAKLTFCFPQPAEVYQQVQWQQAQQPQVPPPPYAGPAGPQPPVYPPPGHPPYGY
ncbi:hypothetical protein QRX60_11350 [Amycolatopsis mongoliensis]|uniref:Uncharacterized protein n=1 Tax=Amycolatopsis mongoliensis TaxID=715475 RepID=A0A9Y2JVJ3_9PSEU|nr:hypothetical protein [Amycolatopsis sp. 4-36]WIY04404.1 hypothetical protein QRX60_11350 [Amycolatopsis sp. 4-36]